MLWFEGVYKPIKYQLSNRFFLFLFFYSQPNPSTDSVANQIQKASNEPKSIDLSAIESNIECDQSSSSTPTTPMEDDSRCKLSGSKSFAQVRFISFYIEHFNDLIIYYYPSEWQWIDMQDLCQTRLSYGTD